MAERRNRFAHEVVLDSGGDIWIDGVHFGYHVSQVPTVENVGSGTYAVNIDLFADSVVMDGKPTPYDPDDPDYLRRELDWARMRAHQIVHEGMADVLEWLDLARRDYELQAQKLADEVERLRNVGQATTLSSVQKDTDPTTTEGDHR